MASARISDLNYGHLGEAVYDGEERIWQFSRQPGRRQCWLLVD